MAYIKRALARELKQSAREYPVIVILGPRQSGKTTIAQKCFSKKPYVSLENLDNREFAGKDPHAFLEVYSGGAIIDEVQRVPGLLSYIQTKVDRDKEKGQFVLTGPNQLLLEEKITQSLAGRVSILRLLPLSLKELKSCRKVKSLDEILFKGFYPCLHAEKIRASKWLDNYIETYIDKDVRLIRNVANLSKFNTFLKMCAARAGQLVNLQSLANDCGNTQNSIKSWLSILESSFVVKRLYPYYKNFNKRLVKTPKIFFYDTGVLCRLLSIKSHKELANHALKGAIFENFVFAEIEKHYFNQGEKPPLYFWRDRGCELDFLIEDEKLKIVEVKSGKTINSEFFKNIEHFIKNMDPAAQAYLIYGGKESQPRKSADVLSWDEMDRLF